MCALSTWQDKRTQFYLNKTFHACAERRCEGWWCMPVKLVPILWQSRFSVQNENKTEKKFCPGDARRTIWAAALGARTTSSQSFCYGVLPGSTLTGCGRPLKVKHLISRASLPRILSRWRACSDVRAIRIMCLQAPCSCYSKKKGIWPNKSFNQSKSGNCSRHS